MTMNRSLASPARLFGALCTASLLSSGCGDDPESVKVPTDNSAIVEGQTAYVKFCHELRREGKPIDLTIEFGNPVLARITARTGSCSPPVNLPCLPAPVGDMPGKLLEGTTIHSVGGFRLSKDAEYLMWAEIGNRSGKPIPTIEGVFRAGQCAQYNPYGDGGTNGDGAATDAGASDAGVAPDALEAGSSADVTAPDADGDVADAATD
jgi:hypothetical protein